MKKLYCKIGRVMVFSVLKSVFYFVFPVSTIKTSNIKKECEEFITFVSLIICGVCLFVIFLVVVGMMMPVMFISSASPFHILLYSVECKKMVIYTFFIRKILIYYHNYHNPLEKNLHFFVIPEQLLPFYLLKLYCKH